MNIKFENNDQLLLEKVERAKAERSRLGLEGLTAGLESVIINTEPDNLQTAAQELLDYTGLNFSQAFEDQDKKYCLLQKQGSADFLLTSRKTADNPFSKSNCNPKSESVPNTRLETFVFACRDVQKYYSIQKEQGVDFMSAPLKNEHSIFVQTMPSAYTGNSLGFVQWIGDKNYSGDNCSKIDLEISKPDHSYLRNIKKLDHCATRVRAEERDAAILEFMSLTSYNFDFAVYVESLNSITNVARLALGEYAMVFTSGISPFVNLEQSGPTEKFIYNYGTRVHHMAFETEQIEDTFEELKNNGMNFLVELVGSPEEGLKQTFSCMSPSTLLVNEYIQRFSGFDGFFSKSNVTMLTKATETQ